MFKRLAAPVLIGLLVTLGMPAMASAHVLKVDGSIGVVLHINPDDSPVSGESTNYELAFEDDTGKFDLSSCGCSATLLQNNKVLKKTPLGVSGTTESSNYVVFPKAGVYTLRVAGKPDKPGQFQPFSLDYQVRVTGSDQLAINQQFPALLWVGLGLVFGLILLAAIVMNY